MIDNKKIPAVLPVSGEIGNGTITSTESSAVTTGDQSAVWLLLKRDLYWRPDDCGYTGIRDHAGRYSFNEAKTRVRDGSSGVSMIRLDLAPEFSSGCFDDLARDHLRKQGDILREAIDKLVTNVEMIEGVDSIDILAARTAWEVTGSPVMTQPSNREAIVPALRSHPQAPASGENLKANEREFIALARLVSASHAAETGAGHTNVVNTIDGLLTIINRLSPSQPASGEVAAENTKRRLDKLRELGHGEAAQFAESVKETGLTCVFCTKPLSVDDIDTDDNGATACRQCAAAEREAQAQEKFASPRRAREALSTPASVSDPGTPMWVGNAYMRGDEVLGFIEYSDTTGWHWFVPAANGGLGQSWKAEDAGQAREAVKEAVARAIGSERKPSIEELHGRAGESTL